jgi:hypothetical protein
VVIRDRDAGGAGGRGGHVGGVGTVDAGVDTDDADYPAGTAGHDLEHEHDDDDGAADDGATDD